MPIRRDELMMGGLQGKQGNAIIIGEGRKITIPGRLGTELKETHLVCKVDRKLGGGCDSWEESMGIHFIGIQLDR